MLIDGDVGFWLGFYSGLIEVKGRSSYLAIFANMYAAVSIRSYKILDIVCCQIVNYRLWIQVEKWTSFTYLLKNRKWVYFNLSDWSLVWLVFIYDKTLISSKYTWLKICQKWWIFFLSVCMLLEMDDFFFNICLVHYLLLNVYPQDDQCHLWIVFCFSVEGCVCLLYNTISLNGFKIILE